MGARVYIPSIGRFTQVDPIQGGTDNNYVYVSDPVNSFDLSGEYSSKKQKKKVSSVVLMSKQNSLGGNQYKNPSQQQWDAFQRRIAGKGFNVKDYNAWNKIKNHNEKIQGQRNSQKRGRGNDNDKNNPTAPPNIPPSPYVNPGGGNSSASKAVVAGGAVAGAGVVVWWILKVASPVCGPALPVCAVAF